MVYLGRNHDGRRSYEGNSGKYGGKKATTTERKKYVAPTANHHDVLFTPGTTKDTAEFKDTVQILARHVSTASGWKQGPMLAKAMTDPAAPVYAELPRPEMYTGAARSVIAFASVGPCFQPEAVDTCLARIWTMSLNSAASLVVPDVNMTS